MKNIVLIGFMGSGKTTLGGKLANALKFQFLDTDQMLEKEFGCPISEFFAKEGEQVFRKRETKLLQDLAGALSNTVLATGGGMPLLAENAKLLQQIGRVYYLRASKESTIQRLLGDTSRPLLAEGALEEKVDRLLKERTPLYAAVADYILDTDGKSFYEMIEEVQRTFYQSKGNARRD